MGILQCTQQLFSSLNTRRSAKAVWYQVMEEEKSLQVLTMPLIQRLDRLDHLHNCLEEPRNSSKSYHNSIADTVSDPQARLEQQQEMRPLASALEEVPSKGSLLERVAMLENRVLQLQVEEDEGEKLDAKWLSLAKENQVASHREKGNTSELKRRRRRWLRWIHTTC